MLRKIVIGILACAVTAHAAAAQSFVENNAPFESRTAGWGAQSYIGPAAAPPANAACELRVEAGTLGVSDGIAMITIRTAAGIHAVSETRAGLNYNSNTYELLLYLGGPRLLSPSALNECGFSNARDIELTAPDAAIGSDVRSFSGAYSFRFAFDDLFGTTYTCTIGWLGGWGSELTNECVAANTRAGGSSSADQTDDDTERAISSFMLGRANQLAANQPRLRRFVEAGDGLASRGCNTFSAAGTDMSGSVNGCGAVGNMWTEVSASWGNGTSYSLGTIGAHQFLSPNLLVGGMVQFDRATDKRNNVSGTGWLVGPYFAAKMAEQPLYFEGRLLYGQTRNKITPLGSYTDTFKTERWLAQLRAEGEIIQQNITWIPLFDLTHTRDRSKAYEDSLGNLIRSQSISLTQVTGGMDFRLPLQSDGGSLELLGGMSAIHSSTQGGIADFENTRGRIHMGVSYDSGVGTMIRAGTFYDGIGSGHRRIGGNLRADYRF